MRVFRGILSPALVWVLLCFSSSVGFAASILDNSHYSQVFKQQRAYRIFLPTAYSENSEKRFPVIYFFHGYGGRFNGPAEGEASVTAESRYYDEFNGNKERCGPDPRDNILDYVTRNPVIVVKWDGYVAEQYPRPYDIGPVKQDLQFIHYFPELVAHIDNNYRSISERQGRAVSGLSMGGFMSMFVASKYPHLISSASFFNPSAGFFIGPKAQQIYTPFKHMGVNYIGFPIRQHIGSHDFLRQHNQQLDAAFKQLDLFYESWQYGPNYFKGFHTAVNFRGQFNFHLKHFHQTQAKPQAWYHIDPYPQFNLWGYKFVSNKKLPGFTSVSHVNKGGLTLQSRRWLPDGPPPQNTQYSITTEAVYQPNTRYVVRQLKFDDLSVEKNSINSDSLGKLQLQVSGQGVDLGIARPQGKGIISVPVFKTEPQFPVVGQEVRLRPIIFNKGDASVKNILIELISPNAEIEIFDNKKAIEKIAPGAVYQDSVFRLRSSTVQNSVQLRFRVRYQQTEDGFPHQISFFPSGKEAIKSAPEQFAIADGQEFLLDTGKTEIFGVGNGNGIPEVGEHIAILAKSDFQEDNAWYGLKLIANSSFVSPEKGRVRWSLRPDWSGTARHISELYLHPKVPRGERITIYGEYDYQRQGNLQRDREAAHSFIHKTKKVKLGIEIDSRKIEAAW